MKKSTRLSDILSHTTVAAIILGIVFYNVRTGAELKALKKDNIRLKNDLSHAQSAITDLEHIASGYYNKNGDPIEKTALYHEHALAEFSHYSHGSMPLYATQPIPPEALLDAERSGIDEDFWIFKKHVTHNQNEGYEALDIVFDAKASQKYQDTWGIRMLHEPENKKPVEYTPAAP